MQPNTARLPNFTAYKLKDNHSLLIIKKEEMRRSLNISPSKMWGKTESGCHRITIHTNSTEKTYVQNSKVSHTIRREVQLLEIITGWYYSLNHTYLCLTTKDCIYIPPECLLNNNDKMTRMHTDYLPL